jgi:hypothetical protein
MANLRKLVNTIGGINITEEQMMRLKNNQELDDEVLVKLFICIIFI